MHRCPGGRLDLDICRERVAECLGATKRIRRPPASSQLEFYYLGISDLLCLFLVDLYREMLREGFFSLNGDRQAKRDLIL